MVRVRVVAALGAPGGCLGCGACVFLVWVLVAWVCPVCEIHGLLCVLHASKRVFPQKYKTTEENTGVYFADPRFVRGFSDMTRKAKREPQQHNR